VIGREAHRLDAVAPRVVYQDEEAVQFVADQLDDHDAAQLTPDELRQLLRWHLSQLWQQGLIPDGVTDREQDPASHVVVHEDSAVAYVLGRADAEGEELPDELVVRIIDLHFAYLRAIGAVGPQAPPDESR
jgi:hypothetical protein